MGLPVEMILMKTWVLHMYTAAILSNGEKLLNDIIARKPGDKELIMDVATAFYDSKKL